MPQLLRVDKTYSSPKACNGPSSRTICEVLARRILGADGKDYRADYVHAPFPKISTQHHDCPLRVRVRRLSSLRKSLCSNPERYFMTVPHNPKAAADQARAAYRRTTDQLATSVSRPPCPRAFLR